MRKTGDLNKINAIRDLGGRFASICISLVISGGTKVSSSVHYKFGGTIVVNRVVGAIECSNCVI